MKGALVLVDLTPVRFWLHQFSSGDSVCVLSFITCVVRKTEKTWRRGHKSAWLPVGRHGKRRPPRLAGRLTAPGEESKHRSEENMFWVLSDAGNQARKCVCVWIFVSLCCWVSVCEDCSVCVCVCLKMPSQTPLLWGGNGQ